MTFNEYQQQALVTEAPITDEVRNRYRDCLRIVYDLLEGYEDIMWADDVKKYIFYGKGNNDLFHMIAVTAETPCDLPEDDATIRMVHGWLGIASEVPELANAILRQDRVNVGEETFDTTWYSAIITDAAGIKMEDGAKANIAKLAARYPEKFTEFHAKNRNLKQEGEILSDLI